MKIKEILPKFLNEPDPKYQSTRIKFKKEIVSVSDLIENNLIDSPETVEDRIEDFKNGIGVYLLLVEKTKKGKYLLIDGNHRFEAFKQVFPNVTEIPVAVYKA